MFYQPASGLHQPLLQAGQGPVLNPSRQTQPPPKIPQVVGQQAQRQPHLIRAKTMTRQAGHLYGPLPLPAPLLLSPPLLIEPHHRPARRLKVRHDEPHAREQLLSMELYLRHYSSCRFPTGGLIEKALVPHDWFVAGPPHRARQQFLDVPQRTASKLSRWVRWARFMHSTSPASTERSIWFPQLQSVTGIRSSIPRRRPTGAM